jgi:hypothetical protein
MNMMNKAEVIGLKIVKKTVRQQKKQ